VDFGRVSACASSGGVPRPFPGAALPPAAGIPSAPAPSVIAPPIERVDPVEGIDPVRADLVTTALALRGTPYRNGGSDPSGFDCSGFVQWVFARHARPLPRETQDQYRTGRAISFDTIQPGDLVFFETVARGASHVGVAIGGDQFVHAPSSNGVVRVERLTASYWSARFLGARRIVDDAPRADAD
jgi:peptidoglycan endopeptidase LytE